MRKSTKIVAALGVAAGISIASLPLGTFADGATTLLPLDYTASKESTDVKVGLSVDSAITIASNKTDCIVDHMKINDLESCSHLIAGGSNSEAGFTISVAPKADANGKKSTEILNTNGSTKDTGKIIAKDGVLAAGDGAWNISFANNDAFKNKALTEGAQAVMTTDGAAEKEDTVTYNFATRPDQERGNYSTTLTYTIADNAAAAEEPTDK